MDMPLARGSSAWTPAWPLLRVINYHNTAKSAEDALRSQLADVASQFDTIGLDDLHTLSSGRPWTGARPPLALVFYEGYANHATVAAPVLDELGLTGWFFLPTAFLDVPSGEQEAFAGLHDLGLVEEEFGAERIAMTWDDVAALSRRHVIAAHTATHERIDNIRIDADIRRELIAPYEKIRDVTGRPPAATAFLYGASIDGYPTIERILTETGYPFVFSNTKLQRLVFQPAVSGSD
jgi:peptidoglycan/xylan/chitin deacetylase (PgdA/CDA1 family)